MRRIVGVAILCLLLSVLCCRGGVAINMPFSEPLVIPAPVSIQKERGSFELNAATSIVCTDASTRQIGEDLAVQLRSSTGLPIGVMIAPVGLPLAAVKPDNVIILSLVDKLSINPEGYELVVSPKRVSIQALDQPGLFYGVQTLLQLLPAEIFSPMQRQGVSWSAPCLKITDYPRCKWRGLMLDASRHFFNKEEVKKILDTMALHKLNVFHWHLCDDQGWRIEIKKYPKLTAVGAWRDGVRFGLSPFSTDSYGPDGRYGGFYSQDDIREVVAYAKSKFITVVPEIEMPGHASAALMAYPEFSCTGGPSPTSTYTTDIDNGVFNGVYCAGNDLAFEFLQNVLLEVFDLFPDQYVHIGGDEVSPDNWKKCSKCQLRMKELDLKDEHKLQSYFIQRMEKFVNAHNRTIIGWSEIRNGGLAPNAVLMDWIGGGLEAAKEGHDVVMTPTHYCYFDYYQSEDHSSEPKAQPAYLPLSTVYSFQPIPSKLDPEVTGHILGSQANVWTEFIPSLHHFEYMTYPRLCALAEVVWSQPSSRQFADFRRRLQVHCRRLDELGVNYRRKSLEEN